MVPVDKSYQTQYFPKIFPSPLASTLHIQFYFHLKESSENALWIVIALKSATFNAPKSALETAFEIRILCYFMLFLKKLTKNLEKKLMMCLFWENRSVLHIFCFSACYFFCYWGQFPSYAWLEKNSVYKAALFFPKHFRLFIFVKNYY